MTATSANSAVESASDQTVTDPQLDTETDVEVADIAEDRRSGVPDPTVALLSEAKTLTANREWKRALRLLEDLPTTGTRSVESDQLVAVAATYARKRKRASKAVQRLRSDTNPSNETRNALAAVAIANRDFLTADRLAREAVESDKYDAGAWANLAAGYAGLGWFDQAEDCLEQADKLGVDPDHHWFIGKSVNSWALTRTGAAIASAILFVFVGFLAIAIGITIPFIVREVRLTRLSDRMASVAAEQWRSEMKLRVAHGMTVVVMLILWAAVLRYS